MRLWKIEAIKAVYDVKDELMVLAVGSKFKGTARLWWEAEMDMTKSWMRFQLILAYVYEMEGVGKGQVDERYMFGYIIKGLWDKKLQLALQGGGKIGSLMELKERVEPRNEGPRKIDKGRMSKTTVSGSQVASFKTTVKGKATGTTELGRWQSEETIRRRQCFSCRQEGHLANNCPTAVRNSKCERCGKLGHRKERC